LRRADVVLISDYDKGVCTPGLLAAVTAGRGLRPANDRRPDPRRRLRQIPRLLGDHAEPARSGARDRPRHPTTNAALAGGSREASRKRSNLEAAIITLDKDGMALVGRDGARGVFATRPRQVYDITGAATWC